MRLTRIAITRPLAMLMFICALVILGLVSMSLMKVDRLPNISFPFVSVSVGYPGASPLDVEALIARPIESGLSGLAGVQGISTTASEGRANINLQLVEGADANQTAVDVERRMAGLRGRLPTDAQAPVVNRADPNSFPIMNVALSGKRPQQQIFALTSDIVAPRIQSILGVAEVNVSGGTRSEIQIQVDYQKLEAYGISLQALTTAIQRENVGQPVGSLQEGRQIITLRSLGQLQSIDDLANVQITTGTAQLIRIRDVAQVREVNKEITRYQRMNGQDAVGMSITKQSDANALQVADAIRSTLDTMKSQLPADIEIRVTNDTSRFTRASLEAVEFDLSLAIFMTATVLILFLHSWRNVFIVILAIPTSLISTFIIMYALGFSLNMISLMALALMIGILVDDSIVVLENIHRHIRLGEHPRVAALTGRSEIGLAAIAITLADVVVYMPVAFMQGNIGRLFKEYGITIAVATLFSLFIGFTLTPMLASRWLKEHDDEEHGRGVWGRFIVAWEGFMGWLAERYRSSLGFALMHRPLIAAIGVIAFVSALAMVPLKVIGTEYAPAEDDGNLRISISMPTGSTLAANETAVRQVESIIREAVPELEAMFTSVGGGGAGGGFGGGGSNIDLQLSAKAQPIWIRPWDRVDELLGRIEAQPARERSVFDIITDLRRRFTAVPEANVQMSTNQALGGGGGGGIQVRLRGEDFETLQRLTLQIEEVVRNTPGIASARSSATAQLPEIRAIFDRDRMAELGITTQQAATTMRTAISGTVVSQLRPEGKDQIDITLIGEAADRLDLNQLANLPIQPAVGGAAAATAVRLGQVARFERASGPANISRQDRQRVLSMNATVAQGATLGEVAQAVRESVAAQIVLPAGYSVTLGGQAAQLDTAMQALLGALGLSVLLIYMLLVALYESWLHPLAIMFSLPISLIGAFSALYLTGNTFNLFSMLGMIMLMGLAAKNAILLVDFTNTLRRRGMERSEAIRSAGPTRLRPIMMTTATIVFAMLPMAAKLEAGAESRAPLAVVVIGGVISSTLLTLLFVPVMYSYLDDLQALFGRRRVRHVEPMPVPAEAGSPAPVHGAGGD